MRQLKNTEAAMGMECIKVVLIYEDYIETDVMDKIFLMPECDVENDGRYWLVTIGEMERLLFTFKNDKVNIKNVKDNDVKAVISSNMSIGVNVFFNTLKKLTPILNDFDIEIIEAHHNQKKDAPSGTAMTAFEVIANEHLKQERFEVYESERNESIRELLRK